MQLLKYCSYALTSLSLSLLIGFLSRAVPTIAAIHLIAIAAIVLVFTVNGVAEMGDAPYYRRQGLLFSYIMRCVASIVAYVVVMGVGAWLWVDVEVL